MIDSTNVRVLADNIQKLQKDSSGLASRVTALEVTAPKDYSTTETATGQKWIDGKDVYLKVFSGTFPEISAISDQALLDIPIDTLIDGNVVKGVVAGNNFVSAPINYSKVTNRIYTSTVSTIFSEGTFYGYAYYTKPDPVPGDAKGPEDSEEPETKKTTRKKTTK